MTDTQPLPTQTAAVWLCWWRPIGGDWRVVALGDTEPQAFRRGMDAAVGSGDLVVFPAGKRPDLPRRRRF